MYSRQKQNAHYRVEKTNRFTSTGLQGNIFTGLQGNIFTGLQGNIFTGFFLRGYVLDAPACDLVRPWGISLRGSTLHHNRPPSLIKGDGARL